jgi:glycerol kinase
MRRSAVPALDQGTTSWRAIVFDRAGRPLAIGQREFPQQGSHGCDAHQPALGRPNLTPMQGATGRDSVRPANVAAGPRSR